MGITNLGYNKLFERVDFSFVQKSSKILVRYCVWRVLEVPYE